MRTPLSFICALCLAFVSADAVAQGYVINKKDGSKLYYPAADVQSVGVYNAGEGPEQAGADELTFTVSLVTFKMKKVQAGTFQMGSDEGTDYEKPVHTVTLTKDYYMGETEVTQALWYAVMEEYPKDTDGKIFWSTSGYGYGEHYPAYYISYEDCQSFLTKLNQLTGMTFRFPTEAEWEFAARGGNESKGYTYAGSNTIGEVAWCSENSSSATHPVAQKKANELGLYDMSGNVWEWCADWSGEYFFMPQTDPTGATSGSNRVLRGGSWRNAATNCRVSYRLTYMPTYRGGINGFRLAL